MYKFKRNEVIILLGAGASVEAGIPDSTSMIKKVEALVSSNDSWKEFHDLYYYVRSAIHYADGIKGRIGNEVSYNIERFVEALDELAKRDEHPLFPFVGAWNPKLMEVAGSNFRNVQEFKDKIVEILRRDWVEIKKYEDADYYEGIVGFRQEYQHPLRIFTLNYDLCIEKAYHTLQQKYPERGFENRKWDWRLFDDSGNESKEIFLYKLHGSTDWKKEQDGELIYLDSYLNVSPSNVAIIFGTSYKLQYVDPFLFLAYEFRKWTLDSKLIVSIGYGFGDEHINGIIGQALKKSSERKLLSVAPFSLKQIDEESERTRITKALDLKGSANKQIECWDCKAKEFMREKLKVKNLSALFPEEIALFSEVETDTEASHETKISSPMGTRNIVAQDT